MKIRMVVTLDIPPEGVEAWKTDYGLERASEVRDDIRQYVTTVLQDVHGAALTGWEVTVR